MPTLDANGVKLHYVERGAGDQTVVFAHSFLLDHRQFEAQIEALEDRYRVIAYDHRDHGASGRARGRYDVYDLVDDGAAIIEGTGAAPCHWVGLSTGGFVGMRLAIRRPELLRSMVLMDTAGGSEPWHLRLKYKAMLAVLRVAGVKPLERSALRAMFGPDMLSDPERADEVALWRERVAANDPAALIRFGNAIWSRDDVLGALREVQLPTLVMGGAQDRAIAPARIRRIADAVPGARFELVERSGHNCSIEQPDLVNDILVAFIDDAAGGEPAA